MRTHRIPASVLLLALATSSCSLENPVAPVGFEPAGAGNSQTLLTRGPLDPRLPPPGHEAASAAPEERALFDRLELAAGEPKLNASSNPVVFWNQLTRDLGAAAKLPPPMLARDYALVQVGVFEALVVSEDHLRGNLPPHAVAAGVASRVLTFLFPGDGALIDAAAAEQISLAGGPRGAALGGWALGRAVGRIVVERGKQDGSDLPFDGTVPSGDGMWTGTNPVLPMCGSWKPWILRSGSEIQPDPPYAFGSPRDLADTQEVYDVSLHRTPEQIAIVHKWADRSPATIWNELLNDRIEGSSLDLATSARAHAYLNVALADAFISCWETKYKSWNARPFQRIPGLVTVIPTPNFPTYTSGHSTISAAAAAVMGEVFPSERDYFVQQSEEAAMSRLYAGIHFRHDDEEGTRVGRLIGDRVVDRMRAGKAETLLAGR
jgi:hypothetical protein